jgi:hypothetical protein
VCGVVVEEASREEEVTCLMTEDGWVAGEWGSSPK